MFAGWDDNGDGVVDNTNASRKITVDKTYNIKAIFKPAIKTVTVKANNNDYGSAQVVQGGKKGSSIQVEYGSNVQLIATSKNSYLYRFNKWSHNDTRANTTVTVRDNTTYEAIFVLNTYTVNFYNGNNMVHSTTVIRGSSIAASWQVGSSMPAGNPTKPGALFAGWNWNGSNFNNTTKVNGDINVYAAWQYMVTLNANGGSISGVSSVSYTVYEGVHFNFDEYKPYRNGFSFNGWYSGNTQYSGHKSITSNITVTASWSCKHYYDDGNTMFVIEKTIGDGGCNGCEIILKCKGCGLSDTQKMTGAHYYAANCGVDHPYKWKGSCTNTSEKHNWKNFRCITCKHCGVCRNPRESSIEVGWGYLDASQAQKYRYIAGTASKLCGAHNGKNIPQYREEKSDRAHNYAN